MNLPSSPNRRTVLGLDPRTIRHAYRAESGPRIKSEGGTVDVGGVELEICRRPSLPLALSY
jgi:hypothetical protein